MANGMGCYFHPKTQSVAQCLKCGKGICRNCVDRYRTGDKYAGLCRDCILEAGIECKDHPSKQAETYCERCGDPICTYCNAMYMHICYKCTTDQLNDEIYEYRYRGKIEKMKWILVTVLSAIGLIIGLGIAKETKLPSMDDTEILIITVFWVWICLGIGGNFREAVSKLSLNWKIARKNAESFGGVLGLTLFFPIFFLLLKSLAGPIIPIIKIRTYIKNVKTAKLTVVYDIDLLKKLADYHAYTQYIETHGDNVDIAKLIEQGGALYNNAYADAVLNGNRETYWK